MITVGEVYTNLANALEAEYSDFYCTRTYEPVPRALPCMYFREFHYRPVGSMTLNYDDNVTNLTVYIELYLTDLDSMDNIIALIESTMNSMYFKLEMCTQLDNIDASLERYSLRFFRKLCGGDSE